MFTLYVIKIEALHHLQNIYFHFTISSHNEPYTHHVINEVFRPNQANM